MRGMMTLTEDLPASRREVDQLREELHRIDDHGTRGVTAMQVQVTDLIKDVLDLKSEMNNRFQKHQQQHEVAERERRAGRRWLLSTVIAALVVLVAILTLLLQIAGKVR